MVSLLFLCLGLCGQVMIPADTTQLIYPFETSEAELPNGAAVAYADMGSGEQTILLVHGLGSYMPAWTRNIEELSRHHRVIALDLPGYGKSSKSARKHTIPFFSETVIQLMDELGVVAATLAGHSMGGQIALYTSYHHPERVTRLVLAAPAGFEEFTEQDRAIFSSFISPESIAVTPESMIRQNLRINFHQFPGEAEFMIDDRILMKQMPGFGDYARAQSESIFAMLDEPVKGLLPEIEIPALVIFGANDALIPNRNLHPELTVIDVAKSGAKSLPNSTLKIIDQAGHFVQFERAKAFNRAVLEFLEKNRRD